MASAVEVRPSLVSPVSPQQQRYAINRLSSSEAAHQQYAPDKITSSKRVEKPYGTGLTEGKEHTKLEYLQMTLALFGTAGAITGAVFTALIYQKVKKSTALAETSTALAEKEAAVQQNSSYP